MRKRAITILVIILAIPSCWSAVNIIRENNFIISAESLVHRHKTIGSSYIYDHKIHTDERPYRVEVFIAGDGLTIDQKEIIYTDAEGKGLTRNQILFREEAARAQQNSEKDIVRGIYEYYDKRIQELNRTITDLQLELAKYKPEDTGEKADSSQARPAAETTDSLSISR